MFWLTLCLNICVGKVVLFGVYMHGFLLIFRARAKNQVNVTLVPHIPKVLYVVGSLQWTQRHQPLCWSAHTTVDWSLRLGETYKRQVPGSRRLQTDTVLLYMPILFSQLTVTGREVCMKCLWHSKPCPASYYLATVVIIVPVSVNMPGLYAFPGWHSALGGWVIHYHMQSSLTLTSL